MPSDLKTQAPAAQSSTGNLSIRLNSFVLCVTTHKRLALAMAAI
jgi:hypothetical protein